MRGGGNTIRELQSAGRPGAVAGRAGRRRAAERARRPHPLSLVERCPTGNVAPTADRETNQRQCPPWRRLPSTPTAAAAAAPPTSTSSIPPTWVLSPGWRYRPYRFSAVLVKCLRKQMSLLYFSGQGPSPPRWSGIRKGAASEGKLGACETWYAPAAALAGALARCRRGRSLTPLLIPPRDYRFPSHPFSGRRPRDNLLEPGASSACFPANLANIFQLLDFFEWRHWIL